ncbi:hypothetical protein ACS5PN_03500 [Roseateles sp. NT4]|uniref:hypothetical protein n=1 Tax=Roseateles sp. NT4 TaxID=3453715 RepID=UPI003EEABBB0
MYQDRAHHPLSDQLPIADDDVRRAMWALFVHIGKFWRNLDDAKPYESRLYSFMTNRVALDPNYKDYYATARAVIDQLIAEKGEDAAYEFLFTDAQANLAPPSTPLALTRQKVSNEFVALQMALGGFLAFGALNYPGYFGGANAPGAPVPYRPMEDQHGG